MNLPLLGSEQMALFAARGFLRFDSIVPDDINQRFLSDIGHVPEDEISSPGEHYARVMQSSTIPVVSAGTPLREAYPDTSATATIRERGVLDPARRAPGRAARRHRALGAPAVRVP